MSMYIQSQPATYIHNVQVFLLHQTMKLRRYIAAWIHIASQTSYHISVKLYSISYTYVGGPTMSGI